MSVSSEDEGLLVVRDLKKSFGETRVLDGVDMEVKRRSVTMLIGPNGSGKTTLINTISGFYKPGDGKVLFDGRDITGFPPYKICRRGLTRTFQIPSPFLKLTVLENLTVASNKNPGESFLKAPLKKLWTSDEEKIMESAIKLLRFLELDHLWNEPASALSGGQMKLLEIGRALMSGAKMILMDEPVGGINPTLAHEILSHILRLKEKLGTTFLVVEHRLDLALPYMDYAYVMSGGKIIAEGKPREVVDDPRVIEAYLAG